MNAVTDGLKPKTAISYVRVSTRRQSERGGGDDEGFSIPAQCDANRRKAASLGAIVIKEFVDKGASARSADRKNLQDMLKYIKENSGRIDYLIIHKIDRLARNRDDDFIINQAVKEAGITLVSATEAIDETPSGMLLHGIMSSIAEFYSQNLATEVKKGLLQKAKGGGTITRAPLGYINVRKIDEQNREYRTVEHDAERAPLITLAFQKYATGEYYMDALAEELAAMGLTTRGTPKVPSKPIDGKTLNVLLMHPYYKGVVTYMDVEYAGKHTPLIDAQTWQKVQDVRALHVNGERTRYHDHFLKSTVYCGSCGSRLIIHMSQSKSGNIYPYFVCIGRHDKITACKQKAVLISEVETQIEQLYKRINLPKTMRYNIEADLLKFIDGISQESTTAQASLLREKSKIAHKQQKLLEAHYADALPLSLLKSEQEQLAKRLLEIERQMAAYDSDTKEMKAHIKSALDVLEDCGTHYKEAPDSIKRAFNQAIFERILVSPDCVVTAEYTAPFAALLAPLTQAKSVTADGNENTLVTEINKGVFSQFLPQETAKHPSKFFGGCLSKDVMVETAGLEPATSCM
ncbi:MAG: recombinase family protein [Gracilibacteraceae bacterium]|nr:recombinase family protein [Gracilibacteraceae bacterium]